jgi:hypothetical protein
MASFIKVKAWSLHAFRSKVPFMTGILMILALVLVCTTRVRQSNHSAAMDTQVKRLPASYSTLFAGERALDAVLLLASLALHHPGAHVYISTDSKTYEWFLEHCKILFYSLNLHWTLALDQYNMNQKREEMEASNIWNDFMLEKVGIMEKAMALHNDTMLLDADFVLLEPIYLPSETHYQLGVSPHYMKASEGTKYGIYNGGMLWTNQFGLGAAWRKASTVSRYFEQAAIEDLTKIYTPFFEFGPEHNVGFWRPVHHQISPKEFYSHLHFDANTQTIMLHNRSVATFHTHILTTYPYDVGNKFSAIFVEMLRMSNNPKYGVIAQVLRWGQAGCIPPQMVL